VTKETTESKCLIRCDLTSLRLLHFVSMFFVALWREIDNKLPLRIDILISVLLVVVCFIRIQCFLSECKFEFG